jgi:hypothetical protein
MRLPGRVDCIDVNLDEAPGDDVNPGGESRIARGVELGQSQDVASDDREREGRVTLDEQPMSGAVKEQSRNDAQRERATDEFMSSLHFVDKMDGCEERFVDDSQSVSVAARNEVDCNDAEATRANDKDCTKPIINPKDDELASKDGCVMDASREVEQPKTPSSDIPADQHRWTEEQFKAKVIEFPVLVLAMNLIFSIT